MYEWAILPLAYHGRNFYVNANPTIGNDSNSGTQESPFLTIARGLSELRPGEGDKLWAYSAGIDLPGIGLYTFSENVVMDKSVTALLGHFTTIVNSGIGIEIDAAERVLVSGARVRGDGLDTGYKLTNCVETLVVSCTWTLIDDDPGQVGFELYADPVDPNNYFYANNGFIDCRALGGNIGGGVTPTTGFKLADYGEDANFLLDCRIAKNEVGIDIVNSTTHFEHAIVNCRFYDNDIPCQEADSLHHWYLFANLYDDIEPGLDGWGSQLPWPNSEASWTFAHPDPAPIRNVGALFANKMGTIASTSIIRNTILRKLGQKGFAVTP